MFRYPFKKLTALFITAFVCLNAGGAMCVAYCQTFDLAEEPADHCPLKKVSKHCEGQDLADTGTTSVGAGVGLDCCPMTVSFFAAPVEKNSFSIDAAAEIVAAELPSVNIRFASATTFDRSFNYRGPPLDRRVERIKHCIIRI